MRLLSEESQKVYNHRLQSSQSTFRRLLYAMLSFGLLIGLAFPEFVEVFVPGSEASSLLFRGLCVGAGILMGLLNYLLFDVVVSRKIRNVVDAMNQVHSRMRSGDGTPDAESPDHLQAINSNDVLGDVQVAFNEMTEAVAARLWLESVTRRLLSRLSQSVEIDVVAADLLTSIVDLCHARAGVLYDVTSVTDGYLAVTGFDATDALARGLSQRFGAAQRALQTTEIFELSLSEDQLHPLAMSTPLGSFAPTVVTLVPVLVDTRVVALAVVAGSQERLTRTGREVLNSVRMTSGPQGSSRNVSCHLVRGR